jgi:hypothetical protein
MKSIVRLKILKSGDFSLSFHELAVPVLEHTLLRHHGSRPATSPITRSVYPERNSDQELLQSQLVEWHAEVQNFIEYILPGIKKNKLTLHPSELEEFIKTLNLVRTQLAERSKITLEDVETLPPEKVQTISEINFLALIMETLLAKIN